MNLFHTHKWKEVSRDYTPGRVITDIPSHPLMNLEDTLQQLKDYAAGTTHVYLKCIECGVVKQKDLIGKY